MTVLKLGFNMPYLMHKAFKKSLKIIEGCKSKEQLKTAERYIEMFEKHFGQTNKHKELKIALLKKEAEIFN